MCDYSLMSFPNRLAREGEELMVHRFPSGSKGFAAVDDLNPSATVQGRQRRSFWMMVKDFFVAEPASTVPAVCIPPGARLRLPDIGENFQREFCVACDEEVTFTQLSAAPHTYRDAVRFRSGCQVRLQELPEGQRAVVLSLDGIEDEIRQFSMDADLSRAA